MTTHQDLAPAEAARNTQFDDLIRRHLPLVDTVIRRRTGKHLNGSEPAVLADLQSAGSLALWNAARHFDPARGIKFTTFATRCIERAIIAPNVRAGRIAAREFPLDQPAAGLKLTEKVAAPDTTSDPQLPDTATLPEPLREVVDRLARDVTPKQIARELKITHQAISRRRAIAIEKLQKAARKAGAATSPPVVEFADRPPMHAGLPPGVRHLRDAFPEWWRAQERRGWPANWKRADIIPAAAFAESPSAPPAPWRQIEAERRRRLLERTARLRAAKQPPVSEVAA